jgi:hypothetical protein
MPFGTYPDLHCIEWYIFGKKLKIVSNDGIYQVKATENLLI